LKYRESSRIRLPPIGDSDEAALKRFGKVKADSRMNEPKCAIVVASCDPYEDIWRPLFSRLWKNWPDCPYPVILVANWKSWDGPGVRCHLLRDPQHDDQNWSGALKRAIRGLEEDVILLLIDDLLIARRVNTDKVRQCVELFRDPSTNYVRMAGLPRPVGATSRSGVGEIAPGSVYRTATVMTLWRRECLLRLLETGETCWEFETRGASRSDSEGGFLATSKNVIVFENAIIKGKWRKSVLKAALREGSVQGPVNRPVMTYLEETYFNFRVFLNHALYWLPMGCRRRIRSILKPVIAG
jgi:hypothetical protein